MKTLSPALASHLAGGVTTLCRCWRLIRRDGTVLGFTDHDRDLTFGGVTHQAASGLTGSELEAKLGMAVAGGEVTGALTSLRITEADIASGRYDNAEVEVWLVNWNDLAQVFLEDRATIGEIRRTDRTFIAELRGIMHRLDQEQGRLFTAPCSADLTDSRCRVHPGSITRAATVVAAEGRLTLHVTGLDGLEAGWFTGGLIRVNNGDADGQSRMIRTDHGGGVITLWEPFLEPLTPGVTMSVLAGCDKTLATCHAKFNNAQNYRGFPHIPTPDFVLTYAAQGEGGFDGGALS